MKRMMICMGLLISTSAALAQDETAATTTDSQKSPMLILGAYKSSAKGDYEKLPQNSVRRGSGEKICWTAANLPKSAYDRLMTETLISPEAINLISDVGIVIQQSNNSSTIFSKKSPTPADQDSDRHENCYAFDASDPVGNYALIVQIGDIVFEPPLSFYITP